MLFASFALSAADSLALADVLFASLALSAADSLALVDVLFASNALVDVEALVFSDSVFTWLAAVLFFSLIKDAILADSTADALAELYFS